VDPVDAMDVHLRVGFESHLTEQLRDLKDALRKIEQEEFSALA